MSYLGIVEALVNALVLVVIFGAADEAQMWYAQLDRL